MQDRYSFSLTLHVPLDSEIEIEGGAAPGTRHLLIRENVWEWCAIFKVAGGTGWKSHNDENNNRNIDLFGVTYSSNVDTTRSMVEVMKMLECLEECTGNFNYHTKLFMLCM